MEELLLRKILVLDDDPIHTFILEKFFAQYLSRPCKVYNVPQEALDYLDSLTADQFPEIIFIDIKMPVMNGFNFIETFESRWNAQNLDVKIVVLTSSLLDSDRKKAMSYQSVKHFLTKPLAFSALEEIVN